VVQEPDEQLRRRNRVNVEVSLCSINSKFFQELLLVDALNSFGDGTNAEFPAQLDDCGNDAPIDTVGQSSGGETCFKLDYIDRQRAECGE